MLGEVDSRTWRVLLDDKTREPRQNLACEEALARAGSPLPILRFWRNARCVVLGRCQLARAEVNSHACRKLGVPVYRRFTAGGAVYHDFGNLNVTLVLSRSDPLLAHRPGRHDLPSMFSLVLDPVAAGLRELGCDARIGDRGITVEDGKLTGVAAWASPRRLLVHATLLIDADLDALERVLDGPGAPGNPKWERTRSHRVKVTSLARTARRSTDHLDLITLLVSAFADLDRRDAASIGSSPRRFAIGSLTPAERAIAATLFTQRYSRSLWHAHGVDAKGVSDLPTEGMHRAIN